MNGSDHINRALPFLVCPNCLNALTIHNTGDNNIAASALSCLTCEKTYPVRDGIIDFLPDYEDNRQNGLAQRLMESKTVVSIYETYFRPAFTRLGSSIKYQDELRWLESIPSSRPVQTILDLACGTGKYARLLNKRYQPELVLAIDLSFPMLQQAVKNAKTAEMDNIIHIRGDAGALPIKSHTIDRLNCFGALHLFPDVAAALQQLGRVATPQSIFTCLTSRKMGRKGLNRMISIQPLISNILSFHFFEEDTLRQDLKRAGFRDFTTDCHHMLMMFSCQKIDSTGVHDQER